MTLTPEQVQEHSGCLLVVQLIRDRLLRNDTQAALELAEQSLKEAYGFRIDPIPVATQPRQDKIEVDPSFWPRGWPRA